MNAQEALSYLKGMIIEATYLDDDAFVAIATLEACVEAVEGLVSTMDSTIWCCPLCTDRFGHKEFCPFAQVECSARAALKGV